MGGSLAAGVYIAYRPSRQREVEMARLQPRYTPAEKAVLLMCIRPVERWTADERRTWVRTGTGFRHFIAPNITPIEHYRPKEQVASQPAAPAPKSKPAA